MTPLTCAGAVQEPEPCSPEVMCKFLHINGRMKERGEALSVCVVDGICVFCMCVHMHA